MSPTAKFAGIEFHVSAASVGGMPHSVAEVAIVGRSNSGKSSVINALAGRKRLAFVSKTPGRTQLINFFALGGQRFLVDLPGYGFAKVPQALKAGWEDMIAGYLESRTSLKGLIVTMDVRHPMTSLDLQLLRWFDGPGKPVHVVLTKADKLSTQQAENQRRETERKLSAVSSGTSVQLFSVPARSGVEELEAVLTNWLET
jgi:GTP-binding protein